MRNGVRPYPERDVIINFDVIQCKIVIFGNLCAKKFSYIILYSNSLQYMPVLKTSDRSVPAFAQIFFDKAGILWIFFEKLVEMFFSPIVSGKYWF